MCKVGIIRGRAGDKKETGAGRDILSAGFHQVFPVLFPKNRLVFQNSSTLLQAFLSEFLGLSQGNRLSTTSATILIYTS